MQQIAFALIILVAYLATLASCPSKMKLELMKFKLILDFTTKDKSGNA